MCNSCNDQSHSENPFADLEDEVLFSSANKEYLNEDGTADTSISTKVQPKMHKEKCKDCRGGTFYSWAGRPLGPCRKCKGTGFRYFRQSLEQRQAAKARRDAKKAEAAQEIRDQAAAYARENEEVVTWLRNAASFSEFARSLMEGLNKFGHLTEKQQAAVERIIAKDKAAAAAKAEREANAPELNVGPLYDAFETAQSNGLKRPKMYLGDFKFSLAPSHGNNAGCLYVVQVSTDQYLGKITPEKKFVRVRSTSDEQEQEVIQLCANPLENAIAYGMQTGSCSCCGKELTNEASIERGIGPICAARYGWGE